MIRIIALTNAGAALGARLQKQISGSQLNYKPQPFGQKVQQAFQAGDRLIFICATGIVVRTLAPVLSDKYNDPPVLVLDENGRYIIPLLSGHEGGANQWALEIAGMLGAQTVISTANTYVNPVYTVGMGCARGCPGEDLQQLLMQCLQQADLTKTQIHSINSIEIKADEDGLLELANLWQIPYRTYSVEDLRLVQDKLRNKSDYVYQTVGVYAVAESAALYAAQILGGNAAELVIAKQKSARATCAIARTYIED